MTEEEWLTCSEPEPLFKVLKSRFRHRKLRLFAVACCRLVSNLLPDDRSRQAIDVAERFADGDATEDDLRFAHDAAEAAHRAAYDSKKQGDVFENRAKEVTCLEWAAVEVADPVAFKAAKNVSWMSRMPRDAGGATGAEFPIQAHLVRDIFGNPFRSTMIVPAWLTVMDGAATKLASRIYADGEFGTLPALADVLEVAGCDDANILTHCRQGGLHVRGCWVVDMLTGKS